MPQPTHIKLRTRSRVLEVAFDDGALFEQIELALFLLFGHFRDSSTMSFQIK